MNFFYQYPFHCLTFFLYLKLYQIILLLYFNLEIIKIKRGIMPIIVMSISPYFMATIIIFPSFLINSNFSSKMHKFYPTRLIKFVLFNIINADLHQHFFLLLFFSLFIFFNPSSLYFFSSFSFLLLLLFLLFSSFSFLPFLSLFLFFFLTLSSLLSAPALLDAR